MTDPTPQPDPAVALAGRLTVVSWEEHERLCAIAVAREHHRMVARTADAAARLAAVEAERDRLLATVDVLTEKAPEQRLLEAIFATSGCRCGCGAPRWDEDKTVLRFGWDTPDRCGRCGEDLPAPDAREGAPSSSSESSGHVDAQTTGQPEAMRLDAPDAGVCDDSECGLPSHGPENPHGQPREESCDDCGHLATRHWLPGGCHGTQGTIARACRCARNSA